MPPATIKFLKPRPNHCSALRRQTLPDNRVPAICPSSSQSLYRWTSLPYDTASQYAVSLEWMPQKLNAVSLCARSFPPLARPMFAGFVLVNARVRVFVFSPTSLAPFVHTIRYPRDALDSDGQRTDDRQRLSENDPSTITCRRAQRARHV